MAPGAGAGATAAAGSRRMGLGAWRPLGPAPVAAAAGRTPLPPRPSHYVLRPGSDPRVDPSILLRFDPPEELRTGASILICPGGNYEYVSMSREGHYAAVWLNRLGITAFVLRYRCLTEGYYWPAQMEDLEVAMRLIRGNATAWRLDSQRVGVMGFSAGGFLAGAAAVSRDAVVRPNLQVLVYPTIDVTKPEWWPWQAEQGFPPPEESVHLHVTADAPAAFLAVSSEDGLCTAEENTEPYAARLRAVGVPVEHFIKPMGKHGHGLEGGWPAACTKWLAGHGWTGPKQLAKL